MSYKLLKIGRCAEETQSVSKGRFGSAEPKWCASVRSCATVKHQGVTTAPLWRPLGILAGVRDPWGEAPATKSSGWPRPEVEPRSGRKSPREHAGREREPRNPPDNLQRCSQRTKFWYNNPARRKNDAETDGEERLDSDRG